ncbi:winged helix-turn-helix domain-containing protein [Tessaracoccus sp. MC1865]|uniref:AfsR/SARP family transcriptional regulator n=1 Tax=Tessaracoccus sp. MC1865 TaxID=2760310 RepID=UPI0016026FA5|nr:BTAD domain-containing putative transcriptional regulator [Tessaracoccus sp. MC1865]MBB1483431.1 winged helix-turn-helix domain-containing protein [Tessaracoccus sp. MC1865]QTO36533.1 winged helix-turn-helix domain-containing protein [Tessaracoccus sp. MC1865]
MEKACRIRLLGPARVLGADGAGPVMMSGTRQRVLLAALALRPGRPVPVPDLVSALWGDEPPDSVHNALQVHVSGLRKVVEPLGFPIVRDGATYTLSCGISDVDVAMFEALVTRAQSLLRSAAPDQALEVLERAFTLASGPLLAGLDLTAWLEQARRAIAERHAAARRDHIIALFRSGRAERAVEEARSLVADDPLDEASWSRLMAAQYHAGQPGAALETFHQARRTLLDELGVEPSPELTALQRDILNHKLPSPVTPPTLQGASLPTADLIGRDDLVERVLSAVGSHRLVTLHGLGGVGKSALCIAVVDRLKAAGRRVATTEFMQVSTPRDALESWCRALQLPVGDGDPTQTIARAGPCVLVADNAEQFDGFADLALALLSAAPEATVLVTARQPVGIGPEAAIVVPPLPSDPSGPSAAEELFVRHCRRARPGIDLEDSAADIRELCRLSGGLPLAIELLAARIRVSSPARLVEQLHRSPEALAALTTDRDPRRSIPAVVEWAANGCSPEARMLLRAMAEAAGLVSGHLVDSLSRSPQALMELVDAGLVTGPTDSDHFLVLPPVAQALGDSDGPTRDALLDAVTDLVRPPDGSQPSVRALLDDQSAVLRAVTLSCEAGHPGVLLPWLEPFWLATARVREGIRVLNGALENAHPDDRVALQVALGLLVVLTGEGDPDALEASLRAAETTPWHHSRLVVEGWCSVGGLHAAALRPEEVTRCAQEATTAAGHDPVLRALALGCSAAAADAAGDTEHAVDLGFRSVAELRRHGDPQDLVAALGRLVEPLVRLGRVAQARVNVDEMLELSARHPMGMGAVAVSAEAAVVELAEGGAAASIGMATTVLAKLDEVGCRTRHEVVALRCIALAHTQLGRPGLGARFLGAADEVAHRAGRHPEEPWALLFEPTLAALRAAPEFAENRLIGRSDPDGVVQRWLAAVANA